MRGTISLTILLVTSLTTLGCVVADEGFSSSEYGIEGVYWCHRSDGDDVNEDCACEDTTTSPGAVCCERICDSDDLELCTDICIADG